MSPGLEFNLTSFKLFAGIKGLGYLLIVFPFELFSELQALQN
jgi:hypothetical protein